MARSVSSEVTGTVSAAARSTGLVRRLAVPLFAGWTLFVWGGRLRNLAADPGGFAEASRWSLWGSVVFVSLALLVLATWLLRSRSAIGVAFRPVLAVLVVFTAGVWLVRAIDIALGDRSIGFIAVHVMLAVVSIWLGLVAWRSAPAN